MNSNTISSQAPYEQVKRVINLFQFKLLKILFLTMTSPSEKKERFIKFQTSYQQTNNLSLNFQASF